MGIKDLAQSKRIEILLDKYWKGETTIEEESELKTYFSSDEVASHLQYIAPYFQVLKAKADQALDNGFEQHLKAGILSGRSEKKSSTSWMGPLLRYAALAVVLLGIGLITYQWNKNTALTDSTAKATTEDTYENPEEAYATLKASLQLVSSKLNQGKGYIEELDHLNTGASLFIQQKNEKDEN